MTNPEKKKSSTATARTTSNATAATSAGTRALTNTATHAIHVVSSSSDRLEARMKDYRSLASTGGYCTGIASPSDARSLTSSDEEGSDYEAFEQVDVPISSREERQKQKKMRRKKRETEKQHTIIDKLDGSFRPTIQSSSRSTETRSRGRTDSGSRGNAGNAGFAR